MGFSIMLRGAEKLVPVEYWCPYGTFEITDLISYGLSNLRNNDTYFNFEMMNFINSYFIFG